MSKMKVFVSKKQEQKLRKMAEQVSRHINEFKGAEHQRNLQRRKRAAELAKEWDRKKNFLPDPKINDVKQEGDLDLRQKHANLMVWDAMGQPFGLDVIEILGYPADWQMGIRP